MLSKQLLALANGDRVKAQQRSRSAFIVDMDKKQAAENLLLKMQAVHPTLLPQVFIANAALVARS